MWRYTVPYGDHFMNKTQFNNALKLVAMLQVRHLCENLDSDTVFRIRKS